MAYVKQTWVNGAAGGTPLSAARLNHIEDGIEDVDAALIGYVALTAGGTRTVFVGDSIVLGDDTVIQHSNSWPTYASLYSRGQILYAKNAGITGNTSADVLARFDADVTPSDPGIVIIGIGRNDLNASVPLATYQSNIATLVDKVQAIGAMPVLTTITPTNSSTFVTTAAWNQWMRAFAASRNILLLDFFGLLVDPTTGKYSTAAGSVDGIHPGPAGYAVLGAHVASVLGTLLPPVAVPMVQSDADTNNLVANGCFTGGAVNGSGEPPGWYQQAPAQVTGSLVTGDASIIGNWHRQTTTGASTAEAAIYQAGIPVTIGHRYIFTALVESALSAGGFAVEIDVNGGAVYPAFGLGAAVSTPGMVVSAFTAATGTVNVKMCLASGSNGYVQFAQVGLLDATALGMGTLV